LLETVNAGGIDVVNNILLAHPDSGWDIASQHLAIKEAIGMDPSVVTLGRLENNLMFTEGTGGAMTGTIYAERVGLPALLGGGAQPLASFTAAELGLIPTVTANAGNFVADPRLTAAATLAGKSSVRLTANSPANNAGRANNAGDLPVDDIDQQIRSTTAPDIGHDEAP